MTEDTNTYRAPAIPQDIMRTARLCTTDNEIAAAILGECQRCIALCKRAGSPDWCEATNDGYELAAREIAEDIEAGR